MRGPVGLRRQHMDGVIAGAALGDRAGRANPGQQPHRARRHPTHAGEFVDAIRSRRPERREQPGRGDATGVTPDDDILALLLDRDVGFHRVRIAQNSVMEITGVAEVEQVVDDELVIGANGHLVALGGVHLRDIVEHAEIRNLGMVGRPLAHPDPDRLVLLGHREAADARARRNVLGAMRIEHARAGRVEFEPVIRTLDAIAVDDLAHVQGREAVRAAIMQRRDVAVRFSIEDDRLLHDGAAEQLTVGEIVRPGGDIPCVAQIGSADHLPLAVAKLGIGRGLRRHRGASVG